MRDTPPHLKTLEEIEKSGILGLVEALREGTAPAATASGSLSAAPGVAKRLVA